MNLMSKIEEITDKCIKCGFCESVCPTLKASDYDSIYGARGRVILADYTVKHMDEPLIVDDSFYSCLDCYACVNVCPAGVNAGIVSELMKEMVTENNAKNKNKIAELIKDAIIKFENPLGLKYESSLWSEGIEFDNNDTIILTGHMFQMMAYTKSINKIRNYIDESFVYSMAGVIAKHIDVIKVTKHFYDSKLKEKMEKDLKNIVYILKKSGIKFGYLGENEPYPGMFLYDLGYMKEFHDYANNVYKNLLSEGVKRIITLDPHTYDVMKNKYPEVINNFKMEVFYYSDIINVKYKKYKGNVTVQEPCHMTLHNNEYNALEILKDAANVSLPDRNGKNNMCCGGPDELLFPSAGKKISMERYKQLKEKADKIITVCPLCYSSLSYDDNVEDFSEFMVKLIKKR